MKWVIWWTALLLLLTGCGQPEEPVSCIAEAELAVLEGELAASDAESLVLQGSLAAWYNLNLLQENDPVFRDAYDTILFYSDGVMGTLEIPGKELHQPIYHGLNRDEGFCHDPETAFPIGGEGNHPVLLTHRQLNMEPGELFVIHILDLELTYQVTAVWEERNTAAVPGVDYCSLVQGDGYQILGIRVQ